jgi:hypothetical protein
MMMPALRKIENYLIESIIARNQKYKCLERIRNKVNVEAE